MDEMTRTFYDIIAPDEPHNPDMLDNLRSKIEELITPHVTDPEERDRIVSRIMYRSGYVTDFAVYTQRVIDGERGETLGDYD